MDGKEGFLILLNLAILGIVIAAAVYIFQIGNGNRSVKCTALDKFGDDPPVSYPMPYCTGLDLRPIMDCEHAHQCKYTEEGSQSYVSDPNGSRAPVTGRECVQTYNRDGYPSGCTESSWPCKVP